MMAQLFLASRKGAGHDTSRQGGSFRDLTCSHARHLDQFMPISGGYRRAKATDVPIPCCMAGRAARAMPSLRSVITASGAHCRPSANAFANVAPRPRRCARAAPCTQPGTEMKTTRKRLANEAEAPVFARDVVARPVCLPGSAAHQVPAVKRQTPRLAGLTADQPIAAHPIAASVAIAPRPAAKPADQFKISQTTRPKGRVQ
jgi:hypothetical protein